MLPRAPPSTFFPYTTLFRSLLGIALFLVVHAFFRLRLLSFAYLIPLQRFLYYGAWLWLPLAWLMPRSEEHTSELQSRGHLVCRLLLEKKNEEQNTRQQ